MASNFLRSFSRGVAFFCFGFLGTISGVSLSTGPVDNFRFIDFTVGGSMGFGRTGITDGFEIGLDGRGVSDDINVISIYYSVLILRRQRRLKENKGGCL